jgi:CubicO group peptidase (beta-lactamase class C family)
MMQLKKLTTSVRFRNPMVGLFLFSITSFALSGTLQKSIPVLSGSRVNIEASGLKEILSRNEINTAGIAVIKSGEIAWQGYYGQQSSKIQASADTLFNVASITKTVTAETVLKLVSEGKISLDEPMANYWIDPDLKDEPELFKLTPRMALTHTTGFPNWRFFENDGKLRFKNKPGVTFGYSGEGIQYLAKFVEKKLAQPFEEVVRNTIFNPLKVDNASISVRKNNFSRIARPLDQNKQFHGYYCHPGGYCRKESSYSAAGDMVITVEDYANFMIASMKGEYLNEILIRDRNTLQGIEVGPDDVDCSQSKDALCPTQMGYGLGWNVTQLTDETVIGHRGSDWSTVSIAYYYSGSKDGLVIFFNAPNKAGISSMVEVLQLLDPKSPEIHGYMFRRARKN